MELKKFQWFFERSAESLTKLGALSARGYYRVGTEWLELGGSHCADSFLIAELEKTRKSADGHYRVGRSSQSSYFIPAFDAIIRLESDSSPTIVTRGKIKNQLREIEQISANAYEVAHHHLTGLHSKREFESLLTGWLSKNSAESQAAPSSSTAVAPGVCVLALDIDYFKQVNDSFGHGYGDIVLRAFAARVDRAARIWKDSQETVDMLTCAHPSGEEFLCFAAGAVKSEAFESLAEQIRVAINENVLPTEAEWKTLVAQGEDLLIQLPSMQSRNLSCSIGYVIQGPPDQASRHGAFIQQMLRKADQALYKSKALGRNRCTNYSKILKECGRVLEYRSELNVIAIDIGTEVGVRRGQEFKIYPPLFSGESFFVVDDGRSKKALGKYPRVAIATATVFDTQPSMSFARVADGIKVSIEPNSSLESIELGAISHAISEASTSEPMHLEISGESQTLARYAERNGKPQPPALLLFRIKNQAELIENFGQIAINRCLAGLYRKIKSSKIKFNFFGQIEATNFVLELLGSDINTELLIGLGHELAEELNWRPQVVVGAFDAKTAPVGKESAARALTLARYAASDAGLGDSVVEIFNAETASRILTAAWTERTYEAGLVDFQRFVEYGYQSAELENRAGLFHEFLGRFDEAKLHLSLAKEMDPQFEAPKINLAEILFKEQDYEGAWNGIKEIKLSFFEEAIEHVPFAVLRVAEICVWAGSRNSLLEDARSMGMKLAEMVKPSALKNAPARLLRLQEKIAEFGGA